MDSNPRVRLLLAGLLCAVVTVAALAAAPGTKWRITVSMNGMGMNLPPHTMNICATGEQQDRPPPSMQNSNCSVTQVSQSGNTVRYALHCTGPEKMDGSGEITYTADHYTGHFDVQTAHGAMSTTYDGQKLGACDGTEDNDPTKTAAVRNQVMQQQTQVQQAMAQSCALQAKNAASPYPFLDVYKTGTVQCADAASKQAYCTAFQDYQAYNAQQQLETSMSQAGAGNPQATPFTDSLKLCGLSADTVRASLCARAESDGQLDFLSKQCPVQAQTLAARECAGRSYTSVGDRYRNFCAAFATGAAPAGTAASTPAPASASNGTQDAAQSIKDKAKSALKGLFGR